MACPNVCGTLALLQDYYHDSRPWPWDPNVLSSAQLKALVIHTAHEAGPANGPDYKFGWGLLNAVGAAELIKEDSLKLKNWQPNYIKEFSLTDGDTVKNVYYCDGTGPITVTLCWTDPPGTPVAPALNPADAMLVNDLDVRLIECLTQTYKEPYTLNPANPSAAAGTEDNTRDNVEKINLTNPVAGYYAVYISHKETLDDPQTFALIVTGMDGSVPGEWTGYVSTEWNNRWNWNLPEVPDSTVFVKIPTNCPNYPELNGGNLGINRTRDASYYCHGLVIYNGASVTVNGFNVINDSLLRVEGLLDIGNDLISNEDSEILIYSSGVIYTGKAAGIHGYTWIKDYATYEQSSGELHTESLKIEPEAYINNSGGLIEIYKHGTANANQTIEVDSETGAFYNLTIGQNTNVKLVDCDILEVVVANLFEISGEFDNNGQDMDIHEIIVSKTGHIIVKNGWIK